MTWPVVSILHTSTDMGHMDKHTEIVLSVMENKEIHNKDIYKNA